ncbi:NADP-dependent oxidoreductase [Conexibacter woesei]|uniref:Alcohol dehydrogenase GroES domain protein n=1 Tax=Conexibacter woesei (strain DSM 14684 / CCUG 47730 / CIP 108061 / JCM 11494 / NBRC 100937 / ID131577) TaxID=469383 RepID=D3FF31_CONWI|nr:NADP-dependent oxidoreductase [Conexibacter woesei]ADB51748.1 Alcohol dehydrogenase GroES domain protein [Conexibacter woesei DSM 14684]
MKAVRFDRYGDVDVLEVRAVDDPSPALGEVLVRVRAAAINPGEIAIRAGVFADRWPATFPSGEGSDLAGTVERLGEGTVESGFSVGDAVLGWTDARASHAELVAVPATQLTAKPDAVSWEVAGSLFVAPLAGYAAVRGVAPQPGETVVVAGAAGGVGSVAVQLARLTGATAIGLASEHNHDWLRSRDVIPVAYGEGQEERIRAAAGGGRVDAFVDAFGDGYADLAIALGVAPGRVSTVIDHPAVERLGIQWQGSSEVGSAALLAEVAGLVADGSIEIPIARTYPLEQVRSAYQELAHRHTRGKIVLLP